MIKTLSSARKKLKYTIQAFQKDLFWLPFAIMTLFIIIASFTTETNRYNTFRAFLGFVVPLITGGLSSYAFLEDSAIELRFTTPISAWKVIFDRLGIIFVIISTTSIIFQVFAPILGIDLAPLGNLISRQLIWLVPCFLMLMLGSTLSLLVCSSAGGFAFIGALWIIQLLLRGWFAGKNGWRNILIFYSVMDPGTQDCIVNQVTLSIISFCLLILTHQLLQKHERYI